MQRRGFPRGGSIFKVYRCVVVYRQERAQEEVRRQEKKTWASSRVESVWLGCLASFSSVFFFCFPFSGSEQTCIDLHLLYTLNVWKEKKYFAVHVCVRACIGVCQWMSVASAFECSFFLSYFYDVSAWAKINLRLSSYTPQCSLLAPTVRLSPAFFFFLYFCISLFLRNAQGSEGSRHIMGLNISAFARRTVNSIGNVHL